MNYQNERREQQEDEALARLMDQVFQAEGAWAMEWHRRLRQDPAAAVPKEVEARCLDALRRGAARRQRASRGRVLRWAALAAVLVFTAALVLRHP